MSYAALIANWNGSYFVERCLGSVLAAARRSPEPVRVIVVDDASTDDSPEKIFTLYPGIELIRLKENQGFGRAVNIAMEAIGEKWVFLLNNDLSLPADYFEKLIEAKKNNSSEELFAIGAQTLQWETHEQNHGAMGAAWRDKMIVQESERAVAFQQTTFVQGGSCLMDREKYLALGGFCDVFHPGYWEDYDICYQALKRGWKIYYEPGAVAYHWGKSSMRALLGNQRLALTIKRNHLLFNWLNLTDDSLLYSHLLSLGKIAMARDPRAESEIAPMGRAVLEAIGKLPAVLRHRRARRGGMRRSDRDVLGMKE